MYSDVSSVYLNTSNHIHYVPYLPFSCVTQKEYENRNKNTSYNWIHLYITQFEILKEITDVTIRSHSLVTSSVHKMNKELKHMHAREFICDKTQCNCDKTLDAYKPNILTSTDKPGRTKIINGDQIDLTFLGKTTQLNYFFIAMLFTTITIVLILTVVVVSIFFVAGYFETVVQLCSFHPLHLYITVIWVFGLVLASSFAVSNSVTCYDAYARLVSYTRVCYPVWLIGLVLLLSKVVQ